MIQTKNIENVVVNNKLNSINTIIGQYVKNKLPISIDELENINLIEEAKCLYDEKQEKFQGNYICTKDEFIEILASKIEFSIIRNNYIKVYNTKNMSYEDLINFCKNKYAVNYNLENICNLALKRSSIKINNKECEMYESKNEDKKLHTPLTKLKEITEETLSDCVPLIFKNFVLNKEKSIFVQYLGTGKGKSTAIRRFMAEYYVDKELFNNINRMIYIVDNKNNTKNEYNDLMKIGNIKINAQIIYSNSDSIREHKNEFKLLSPIFSRTDTYKKLQSYLSFKDVLNDASFNSIFDDAEKSFRNEVKSILKRYPGYDKQKTILAKYNFVKNNEELAPILDVYTNSKIYENEILFMNIYKSKTLIDTLFETIEIFTDERFIKNSVVFFDESDDLSTKLSTIITDDSDAQINAYQMVIDIIHQLHISPRIYDKNKNIKNKVEEITKRFKEIELPYHDINIDKDIKDNQNWLFDDCTNSIIEQNDSEYYLVPTNDTMLLTDGIKLSKEVKEKSIKYSNFIQKLSSIYNDILCILSNIANEFQNQEISQITSEQLSRRESISNIVEHYIVRGLKDKNIKEKFINDIENVSKEIKNIEEEDIYLKPFFIVKTGKTTDDMISASIDYYGEYDSTEKQIYNICNHGGKLILSSATANNKSIVANFNLEWDKINNLIYIPTTNEMNLLKQYVSKLDKNYKNVKIHFSKEDLYNDKQNKQILLKYIKEHTLDDFESKCLTMENGEYKFKTFIAVFVDIINKINNGSRSNLMILKSNFDIKNGYAKDIYKELKEYYKDKNIKLDCLFADSKSFLKIKKEFESLVYDQTDKNHYVFLIGTEAVFGKAVNLQFNAKLNKDDIIELNEYTKINKDFDDGTVEAKIDLSGIYIGEITHLLPSLDGTVSSVLMAILKCRSLYAAKYISLKEYNLIIQNILKNVKYPFDFEKKQFVKIAHVLKIISQEIGRLVRTNFKFKDIFISIEKNNFKGIEQFEISDFYDDNELDLQSFIIKETLKEIFDDKTELSDIKPANANRFIEVHNRKFNNLLIEGRNTNNIEKVQEYSNFRNIYKSLTLNDEQIKKLDSDAQSGYFRLSPSYIGTGGYSYNYETKGREKTILGINVISKYSGKVNFIDFGLTEEIKTILEKEYGFDFDYSKTFALTPKAYEIFLGNTGEAIADLYIKKCKNGYLYTPPTELSEVADIGWNLEPNKILIDAKYFVEQNTEIDNYEKNETIFHNKLVKANKYYNQQVVLIELNTRIINNKYKIKKRTYEEGIIITVPNIYKNNNGTYELDEKVLNKIIELIM